MTKKPASYCLFLLLLVSACDIASSEMGADSVGSYFKNKIALVAECGDLTQSKKLLPTQSMIFGQATGDTFCADTDRVVEFNSSYLRIVPYKSGRVDLWFRCKDGSGVKNLLGDPSNSPDKIGLVAGESLVGVYLVSRPDERDEKCGVLSIESLEKAVEVCEAAANAWGGDAGKCFELCESGLMNDESGICVLHNNPSAATHPTDSP